VGLDPCSEGIPNTGRLTIGLEESESEARISCSGSDVGNFVPRGVLERGGG